MTQKIITVGDIICLLQASKDNSIIEYTVKDAGIGIPESGNYQVGFWLEQDNGDNCFEPEYVIFELVKAGLMWKKGTEQTAQMIRDLRVKQKQRQSINLRTKDQ